jgi:SAM-dependent methyltransferase
MPETTYLGDELTLFQDAKNWKAYFASRLAPYLEGDVLEVGAGLGGTTRVLCDGRQKSWLCLEPDPALARRITEAHANAPFPRAPEVVAGSLDDLAPGRLFDAILYIDVLEHIEDDRAELERAAARLRPHGALIVLSPAFESLFSEFDRAVGHYRRYTKSTLAAVFPPTLHREKLFYLDSIGMLTSLVNRYLLKQGTPNPGQIKLWDRAIVPLSRIVDPLLLRSFGRSIVAIYRK